VWNVERTISAFRYSLVHAPYLSAMNAISASETTGSSRGPQTGDSERVCVDDIKKTSVALSARKRTIPTERPPLVGEI
jgi:hypothetical protein